MQSISLVMCFNKGCISSKNQIFNCYKQEANEHMDHQIEVVHALMPFFKKLHTSNSTTNFSNLKRPVQNWLKQIQKLEKLGDNFLHEFMIATKNNFANQETMLQLVNEFHQRKQENGISLQKLIKEKSFKLTLQLFQKLTKAHEPNINQNVNQNQINEEKQNSDHLNLPPMFQQKKIPIIEIPKPINNQASSIKQENKSQIGRQDMGIPGLNRQIPQLPKVPKSEYARNNVKNQEANRASNAKIAKSRTLPYSEDHTEVLRFFIQNGHLKYSAYPPYLRNSIKSEDFTNFFNKLFRRVLTLMEKAVFSTGDLIFKSKFSHTQTQKIVGKLKQYKKNMDELQINFIDNLVLCIYFDQSKQYREYMAKKDLINSIFKSCFDQINKNPSTASKNNEPLFNFDNLFKRNDPVIKQQDMNKFHNTSDDPINLESDENEAPIEEQDGSIEQ